MNRRIIITAGGTGGHIFPAIAVGKRLLQMDPAAEILFVGATGGMEMTLVPKHNFRIEGVTVSGLMRRITVKNIFRNLAFPFKLMKGMSQAKSIVRTFQPDVVVGFGGYASGPVGKVATKMNIPLVLCEANAYPGMTNKLLAPKAARILLGNDAALKFFDAKKTKVTGNPVRENLRQGNREAGFAAFGMNPARKLILSLGGSLGAGTINDAIRKHLGDFEASDVQIVWQCGKRYYDELNTQVKTNSHVKLVPFIDNMADAFAAADLVITRAGASTISELIELEKPAIYVPSPNVAEDHQTKNARSVTDAGGGELVKDADAMDRLVAVAIELVKNESRLAQIKASLSQMDKHDAAREIAEEIFALIKR